MSGRVLIIDDDERLAAMLSGYLAGRGYTVEHRADAAGGLAQLRAGKPDAVVLDVMLPDLDGFEVLRRIRAVSEVPVVMLTARGEDTDRIVGLELGADDYVVKPFSGAEVIARIRAILRRTTAPAGDSERDVPPGPVTVGDLHVDIAARRARLDGEELQLSRKEFDLLAELIRNAGRVVTREQLMDRVWDENWFGSTKTLDVHVRWLRQKLGDDPSEPRYLHTVRGVGFRFTAPEELT
jgi:DNA-binding response OmpR family regulator